MAALPFYDVTEFCLPSARNIVTPHTEEKGIKRNREGKGKKGKQKKDHLQLLLYFFRSSAIQHNCRMTNRERAILQYLHV